MKTKARVAAIVLGVVLPVVPSRALPPTSNSAPAYAPNHELSISGTVQTIEIRRGDRFPAGAYLTLLTTEGSVDVQLSPAAPRGAVSYGLLPGDRVEVTGCIVVLRGQRILLAREVRRGSAVLTFRNKLGFPLASRGGIEPSAVVRR